MKKTLVIGAAALTLLFAGCSQSEEEMTKTTEETEQTVPTSAETEEASTQTISYLGSDYIIATEVNSIIAASLEAMEDAAALGIKPTGVLEVAGEIPAYLADDLAGAKLIGDKKAPNVEAILALDPDIIVGTSKWGEDTMAEMNKIQTTLPYSHISSNWKENLVALAQAAGKEDVARSIIEDYEKKAEAAKAQAKEELADKTVLVIRVRGGQMYVYPKDVYLNPVIYEDLGINVPEIVENAKAQSEITLETLASLNPDAIFLQFEEAENADAPTALEDLQNNPVFKSLVASQNNQVFVNTVEPLAQGGTAWSKVRFLDAVVKNLLQ